MTRLHNADYESVPLILKDAIEKGTLEKVLLEVQVLASKGDNAAKLALAHAYFYGGHGVEKNYSQARNWLESIDEYDQFGGLVPHLLGKIAYQGLMGPKDARLAFKYFRRAALLGYTKSRIMVAVMQRIGDGTIRKPKAAKYNFFVCSRDRSLSFPKRMYLAFEACVG